MHPGPINRGVEIDSEVADGAQSVILDQVTNGLAVRMAVLYLCGGIATHERDDHPQRPHHRSREQARRDRRSLHRRRKNRVSKSDNPKSEI